MSATFGGGWDAQLGLAWDELLLRWIEAVALHEESWGRLLGGEAR